MKMKDLQIVGARLDSVIREGSTQECDVSGLVFLDLLETAASEVRQTSVGKIRLTVFFESLSVECVLEMFECESEVQDLNVYILR